MTNDVFATLNALTTQTLDNLKKLGETNLKLGEKLLKEQVELTGALVEAATSHAQEVSTTKDVKEATTLQTEFVQGYGKKLLDSSKVYADILAEAGKVYNQVFEAGVKAAGENMDLAKAAAVKATTAATSTKKAA